MSEPADIELYNKVKKKIYRDNPKHSAYRSGLLVQQYKKEFKNKYGDLEPYIGKKTKKGLTRWFQEKWLNQRGEVGYKFKSDIYRPTKRVTARTPRTFSELSKLQLERARREKALTGRVKKF